MWHTHKETYGPTWRAHWNKCHHSGHTTSTGLGSTLWKNVHMCMHVHVVHINAFRIFSYSSTAQLWSLYRRLLVRKWSKRFQQMLQQSDRGPTWHRHNSQPYHRLHNIEDTHTEPWKNISGARVIWLCSCSRVTQVAQSKCLHAPWRHIILGVLWHFILGHIVDSVKYRHLSKL